MRDLSLTHDQILGARAHLQTAKSTNGLTSVKLHKIRQALDTAAKPLALAFDEIQQRCARKDDAGKPVQKLDDGQGVYYKATGTPFYEPNPDLTVEETLALVEELKAFYAATDTLRVPDLTETDLAWITSDEDAGAALSLFAEPSAAAA